MSASSIFVEIICKPIHAVPKRPHQRARLCFRIVQQVIHALLKRLNPETRNDLLHFPCTGIHCGDLCFEITPILVRHPHIGADNVKDGLV